MGIGVFKWRNQVLAREREERYYAARQSASLEQQEHEVGEVPVNFEFLMEQNPDIYAWITVPGTGIDTPVLQKDGDVAYYLKHSWQGEVDANGAICSESRYNGKEFTDAHTVLYGNNCSDGSLFAGLHNFADETFFQDHRVIAVYTPDAVRYYRIFAAYEYDSRHLLQSFDFSKPQVLKSYIEEIMSQRNLYAQLDSEAVIEDSDKILTLSTGSSTDSSRTYLVQGVLEKTFLQ